MMDNDLEVIFIQIAFYSYWNICVKNMIALQTAIGKILILYSMLTKMCFESTKQTKQML